MRRKVPTKIRHNKTKTKSQPYFFFNIRVGSGLGLHTSCPHTRINLLSPLPPTHQQDPKQFYYPKSVLRWLVWNPPLTSNAGPIGIPKQSPTAQPLSKHFTCIFPHTLDIVYLSCHKQLMLIN